LRPPRISALVCLAADELFHHHLPFATAQKFGRMGGMQNGLEGTGSDDAHFSRHYA
jgi:hypothetical protein